MIPCINQATVLTTDTLRFLEVAKENGFTYVELDIGKVEESIAKQGIAKLKQSLLDDEITVVSLNAIENYPILTREEMDQSLTRCGEIMKLSASLNCRIVVVNPNEATAALRMDMTRKFDEFMIEAAKIANAYDVLLGFEYVSYDNRIINSLEQSLAGIHRWDSGIGLVLDVFHMYRSGETIKAMSSEDSRLLWAFHANDAPNTPILNLRDSDRVMPLEGVINLRECVRELRALNFTGPVSVELFNEKYWEMDPDFVIAKARITLKELGV